MRYFLFQDQNTNEEIIICENSPLTARGVAYDVLDQPVYIGELTEEEINFNGLKQY